jgi:hypothetical protein
VPQLRCPHCLEMVQADEDSSARCPFCGRDMSSDVRKSSPLPDYVAHPQEGPKDSPHIKEYVQSLEKRARKERKRQPYHRPRTPVGLITGILFILGGVAFLGYAFLGDHGMMTSLINGILPAAVLIVFGVTCIVTWNR